MKPLAARVKGGKLVGDDDVELPDGEVVYVSFAGDGAVEPTSTEQLELDVALTAAEAARPEDWIPAQRVLQRR